MRVRSIKGALLGFRSYLLEVEQKPGKLQEMDCRLSNMTIVKILFRGGNRCTYAHYCIERSIFAHWVLDESGDFVCYFKTFFIAFYGKRLW